MGRDIRRVPPNWEHPQKDNGDYQPLFERNYDDEKKEWLEGLAAWEAKTHPDYRPDSDWWEWHGNPPDREYCIPYKAEDATWYQMYETVSEGTPLTPPFATKEELVDYLVKNGDFWAMTPWSREKAEAFVDEGYAPSMIVDNGQIIMGEDVPLYFKKKANQQ